MINDSSGVNDLIALENPYKNCGNAYFYCVNALTYSTSRSVPIGSQKMTWKRGDE